MAQTSYNMHVKNAIKQIAQRFQHLEVTNAVTQTGPIPKYVNDFVNIVKADENVQSSNGPIATIDVQLDHRNVIAALCYHITRLYPELEIKRYPSVTPPALMAYCLALVYAHALINDDTNIRRRQSQYAHEVYTTRFLDRVVTMLRKLPIPPFMKDILDGLKRSYDERKPQLWFVHSFACFDLNLDYGRTPPISMYLEAHNIIASQPTNAPPSQLLFTWLDTELMTAPKELKVANYVGLLQGDQHFVNWFAELNFSLFNPVTNRTQTVRPTLTKVDLVPQNLGNNASAINPYIHLLGLDPENFTTIESQLQSIALIIEDTYPNAPELGSIVDTDKSQIMLNHYYSEISLPTWYGTKPTAQSMSSNVTSTRASELFHYRRSISYTKTKKLLFPTLETSYIPNLYLAKNVQYDAAKDPHQMTSFRPLHDTKPDVRHFCPFETSSNNIYSNLICGRLIEFEEITSTSVPQPDPANSILDENSYFLESAVPIEHVTPIHCDNAANLAFVKRTIHPSRQPTVRIDLINRAEDRIPYMNPDVPKTTTALLPGFHTTQGIQTTKYACNSYCTTIEKSSTGSAKSDGFPTIHAWSSYRYYNIHQTTDVAIQNRKLLLLNFRTQHGTNVTLVETSHPSVSIRRP